MCILVNCFAQNTDYVGNPVRDTNNFHLSKVYSAEDCQSHCQSDTDCKFWVWISGFPKTRGRWWECWLKTSNENNVTDVGKVAGPKFCPGTLSMFKEFKKKESFLFTFF